MEYIGQGNMALKYNFIATQNEKAVFRISLGSYGISSDLPTLTLLEFTNAAYLQSMGIATQEEGDDFRVYHLDGYYEGGLHTTLGFYEGEPPYDRIRTEVLATLEGTKQPVSSSTNPQAKYV
jgi:hypothetical protein